MSLLAALPIVGKVLGGAAETFIGRLGENERREFESMMKRLDNEYQVQLAQIETNKAAAGHSSMFVAGARPFILWVCGVGIAAIVALFVIDALNFTIIDIDREAVKNGQDFILMLAIPLLGLGGMRTVEKFKGVARNSIR